MIDVINTDTSLMRYAVELRKTNYVNIYGNANRPIVTFDSSLDLDQRRAVVKGLMQMSGIGHLPAPENLPDQYNFDKLPINLSLIKQTLISLGEKPVNLISALPRTK